jgi:hypothetical protein
MREAGIDKYLYIDWFRDHPIADDLKIYRWNEAKLGGMAHVDWKAFDHPDLGAVEIGGWNRFHAFGNPPCNFSSAKSPSFEVAGLAGAAYAQARVACGESRPSARLHGW